MLFSLSFLSLFSFRPHPQSSCLGWKFVLIRGLCRLALLSFVGQKGANWHCANENPLSLLHAPLPPQSDFLLAFVYSTFVVLAAFLFFSCSDLCFFLSLLPTSWCFSLLFTISCSSHFLISFPLILWRFTELFFLILLLTVDINGHWHHCRFCSCFFHIEHELSSHKTDPFYIPMRPTFPTSQPWVPQTAACLSSFCVLEWRKQQIFYCARRLCSKWGIWEWGLSKAMLWLTEKQN